MGLRVRKSIKLGKFARLNLSKSGVSLSTGIKGARVSVNNKGVVRQSVGVPGSGVYYSEQHKISGNNRLGNKLPVKKIRLIPVSLVCLVLCAFGLVPIGLIIFGGSLLWNHGVNNNKV